MRRIVTALVFGTLLTSIAAAQPIGKFSGMPVVQLLDEGRNARVVEEFSFTDAAGLRWVVPKGTVVDGASIPQPFWTLIGGPWEGAYRDASIIHDYYCDRRSRTWKSVHRVFYEGMSARNVDPLKAKLMYYAVYRFGPRWEKVTTQVPSVGFDGRPTMVDQTVIVPGPTPAYDPARVANDQTAIASGNLSLEQIEVLADAS